MWFDLSPGLGASIAVKDEQAIWPAPDGSNSELVITTEAVLSQTVRVTGPKMVRLAYRIDDAFATMVLSDQAPAPWPDTGRIIGSNFEIVLTDRGAMVVPDPKEKLPNRYASWFETVYEDIRSCWPVPPEELAVGARWHSSPSIPGGLPPGAVSGTVKVMHEALKVEGPWAEIAVRFSMRVELEPLVGGGAKRADGEGELIVTLHRTRGFVRARRRGVLELIRPGMTNNKVVRSRMQANRMKERVKPI